MLLLSVTKKLSCVYTHTHTHTHTHIYIYIYIYIYICGETWVNVISLLPIFTTWMNGFEVLKAARINMTVFSVAAPCCTAEVYRRFSDMCCLNHQSPWWRGHKAPLNHRRTSIRLHGATTETGVIFSWMTQHVTPSLLQVWWMNTYKFLANSIDCNV
jgi:hypothetical protein